MTLSSSSADLATDASVSASSVVLKRPLSEQETPMNSTATTLSPVEPIEPYGPRPPGERAVRAPVARCADGNGTMTGLFFSDNVIDIARAKAMCGLCPLQGACLSEAIERQEPWGVWGGELLSGGRVVTNKRACGRPPKHPRPEVIIDELGPVSVVA